MLITHDQGSVQADEIAASLTSRLEKMQLSGERPTVRGVCIDSDHSFDRDDAIWFDINEQGELVVDITIADVAGFLQKNSPLDLSAQEMAETHYGADTVIKPMLPFRLSQDDGTPGDGLLSLTDKGLRPGVTTRVTLNTRTGAILSTEFFPSLIQAEIINYTGISGHLDKAMFEAKQLNAQTVAQINDSPARYALWQHFTVLLNQARHHDGEGVLPLYRENKTRNTITEISEEGTATELQVNELAAHRIVEETALLANRAKAQFFSITLTPYMFRVHEAFLSNDPMNRRFGRLNHAEDARMALLESHRPATADPHIELDRARYHHKRGWHAGLDEYAYAHSTSPLRRYPDIINQRMEHWVFHLMHQLESALSTHTTSLEPQALHRQLWEYNRPELHDLSHIPGTQLLQWLVQLLLAQQPKAQQHARSKLQQYLLDALQVVNMEGELSQHLAFASETIARWEKTLPLPPYHSAELAALASSLNNILVHKQAALSESLRALLADTIQRSFEKAEEEVLLALRKTDHTERREIMSHFSADKRFPLLLHLAAETRKEYTVPASLIIERLERNELKEPWDLATILAELRIPTEEDAADDPTFATEESQQWLIQNINDWHELKERILLRFDRNPAFTKGFLKTLEQRYGWTVHSSHASLIDEGGIAAIVSLHKPIQDDQGNLSERIEVPPYFSIGHWGKTTRHHARIEFLRALAYERLQADTPPALPYALEMMVYDADHNNPYEKAVYQEIDKLALEHDLHIRSRWHAEEQQFELHLTGTGPNQKTIDITHKATHPEKATARHLAYQQLLRSSVMRQIQADLFARYNQLEQIPINADDAIYWMDQNSDIITATLDFKKERETTSRNEEVWQAQLLLEIGGSIRRAFDGESTQQEVAGTFATEAALRYLRQRAEHGDSRIAELLSRYEESEKAKYITHGTNRDIGFAAKVPYAAHIDTNGSPQANVVRPLV